MSTPISRNSNMEGFELYAPRRKAKESAPKVDESQSPTLPQTSVDSSADEPSLASETDQDLSDAECAQAAHVRVDDAIQAAINLNGTLDDCPSELRLPPAPNLSLAEGEAVDRPVSPSELLLRARRRDQFPRRRRSRLDPEILPERPNARRWAGVAPSIIRYSLAIALAATAAYGFTMISSPQSDVFQPKGAKEALGPVAAVTVAPEAERNPPPQSRLVVADGQTFANEPLALDVSVDNAVENESLQLAGLTVGTRVSAGVRTGASSWKLPLHDLKGLYLYAPVDFVGVMNAAVDLVSPEAQLLDHRGVQLEWLAKKQDPSQPVDRAELENSSAPVVQLMDQEEAATLMKRGQDFLAAGDITAARIMFGRLTDAGIADGALAAATTYDPRYLADHNVIGVRGDETKARALYQRAVQLGSTQAGLILQRMVTK
jgi:hypothetical protein